MHPPPKKCGIPSALERVATPLRLKLKVKRTKSQSCMGMAHHDPLPFSAVTSICCAGLVVVINGHGLAGRLTFVIQPDEKHLV